jgi:hypothetical protein
LLDQFNLTNPSNPLFLEVVPAAAVPPEPGMLGLLGVGVGRAVLGLRRRRSARV